MRRHGRGDEGSCSARLERVLHSDSPSDFCVALVALDAVVEIQGRSGRREVPLETFYRAPGDAPERETVLEPGELVVAVRLPPAAAGFASHSRYLKVRDRTSYAFAVVSAVADLRIEGNRVIEGRLALGGVASKPWRARAAEELLNGQEPGEDVFQRVADAALAEAKPTGGTAFKIELARRVVKRVLHVAVAGTPGLSPALPGSVFDPTQGSPSHA
jgi:xanthine dehydrogenase YagS FAD-binding subunit